MENLNENEQWMELPYFDGKYQVSNYGKVKRSSDGYIMKPYISEKGFLKIDLQYNGVRKKFFIHRIVAEIFLPNFDNCKTVLHKNGIKTDNRVDNLELGVGSRNKIKLNDNEICHVEPKQYLSIKFKNVPVRKWTDETVIEASKQCKSAVEFRDRFSGAYDYAHKTDLWKTFTWLRHNTDPNKRTYVIYAYEDIVNKFVYVGLTNNIERRIKEHRKKNYKNNIRKYDIVRQYFEDNGLVLPEPVIKCSGINGFEAQELEDYYKEEYRKNGWNIINTGKTGKKISSLGNLSFTPLTREDCAKVVKLYNGRKELETNSWRVYATIKRNGWEDLLPPKLKRGSKVDKEFYRKACNKYVDRNTIIKVNNKLYNLIKTHGWLDEFFPSRYDNLSENEILERIKVYKTLKDLKINNYELYEFSKNKFDLNKIFIQKKKINKTNINRKKTYSEILIKTMCNEYNHSNIGYNALAKKYHIDKRNVKKILIENGIEIKPKYSKPKWTIDSAKIYAYQFNSRNELQKNSKSCYNLLRVNNLLDIIYGKRVTVITVEDCIEKAIKYRTWSEFAHKYKKRAKYCRAEGIVDLIKEQIRKNNPEYKPQNNYSIDIEHQKKICLDAAQSCKTKVEFRTKYKHEYSVASANKWLKEYTWLTGCKGVKDEEKKNKAIEVARQCITKREFREEHPVEYSLAVKYKILKDFTWLKGCKKVE